MHLSYYHTAKREDFGQKIKKILLFYVKTPIGRSEKMCRMRCQIVLRFQNKNKIANEWIFICSDSFQNKNK